jgi:hypothetical protein
VWEGNHVRILNNYSWETIHGIRFISSLTRHSLIDPSHKKTFGSMNSILSRLQLRSTTSAKTLGAPYFCTNTRKSINQSIIITATSQRGVLKTINSIRTLSTMQGTNQDGTNPGRGVAALPNLSAPISLTNADPKHQKPFQIPAIGFGT